VIISDLRMPGVSGIELHARLAAQRPSCSTDSSCRPATRGRSRPRSSCAACTAPS
jgi:CheY-like chemotaxis protein